jgi:glutamate-1-semialdehyde 2,1-aminomutase
MVVGKTEIMDQLKERKVLGPGTFMGYPFGMVAALTNLKILEKDGGAVYREMDRIQLRLMDGLREISRRRGIPLLLQGSTGDFQTTGVFHTIFGVETELAYTEADLEGMDMAMLQRFWKNIQEEGILMLLGGRWYLSAGHTDADVDKTVDAADRAMAKL